MLSPLQALFLPALFGFEEEKGNGREREMGEEMWKKIQWDDHLPGFFFFRSGGCKCDEEEEEEEEEVTPSQYYDFRKTISPFHPLASALTSRTSPRFPSSATWHSLNWDMPGMDLGVYFTCRCFSAQALNDSALNTDGRKWSLFIFGRFMWVCIHLHKFQVCRKAVF